MDQLLFDDYYSNYIDLVNPNYFLSALADVHEDTQHMLRNLREDESLYRYADNKWTIKEIIVHLIDSERIFNYRALRIARGEEGPYHGFDHNRFVEETNANNRRLASLLEEYQNLRVSTIDLFKSFSSKELGRKGVMDGNAVNVRALGAIIPGHEFHHQNIIKAKYLK